MGCAFRSSQVRRQLRHFHEGCVKSVVECLWQSGGRNLDAGAEQYLNNELPNEGGEMVKCVFAVCSLQAADSATSQAVSWILRSSINSMARYHSASLSARNALRNLAGNHVVPVRRKRAYSVALSSGPSSCFRPDITSKYICRASSCASDTNKQPADLSALNLTRRAQMQKWLKNAPIRPCHPARQPYSAKDIHHPTDPSERRARHRARPGPRKHTRARARF